MAPPLSLASLRRRKRNEKHSQHRSTSERKYIFSLRVCASGKHTLIEANIERSQRRSGVPALVELVFHDFVREVWRLFYGYAFRECDVDTVDDERQVLGLEISAHPK